MRSLPKQTESKFKDKDLTPKVPLVTTEYVLNRVIRQIDRNIRSGDWKSIMENRHKKIGLMENKAGGRLT